MVILSVCTFFKIKRDEGITSQAALTNQLASSGLTSCAQHAPPHLCY